LAGQLWLGHCLPSFLGLSGLTLCEEVLGLGAMMSGVIGLNFTLVGEIPFTEGLGFFEGWEEAYTQYSGSWVVLKGVWGMIRG